MEFYKEIGIVFSRISLRQVLIVAIKTMLRRNTLPYHVRITSKSNNWYDEVKLDLTEIDLVRRVITPYNEGRPIVLGGRTIPVDDIERLRINFTEESSDKIFPIVRRERMAGMVSAPISDEWYVADKGKNVTDEFITGPPGSDTQSRTNSNVELNIESSGAVFVVHGRDLKLKDSLFSFLRSIGLRPLEWTEAILATGKTAPYIGEILDKAFETAQAIIVLFTPDDEARLRQEYWTEVEPIHETNLTPQARPNVIFEAGMAMGRDPDRTILIEIGNLRPFSDLGGRHVIRLDNSTQRRQEVAQRLMAAKCPVILSGTDWHLAGNFSTE